MPLGAGLSVASGIPTFRGTEDNAVWNKNIIEVGTRRAFLRDPRGWYVILARPVSVAPYSLNIDVLGETVRMIPRRIADLTFAQTHKHTKTHAHAHTHTHTRTHTRTRTRTRTRTHTRTHARSLFLSFSLSLSLSVCVWIYRYNTFWLPTHETALRTSITEPTLSASQPHINHTLYHCFHLSKWR